MNLTIPRGRSAATDRDRQVGRGKTTNNSKPLTLSRGCIIVVPMTLNLNVREPKLP